MQLFFATPVPASLTRSQCAESATNSGSARWRRSYARMNHNSNLVSRRTMLRVMSGIVFVSLEGKKEAVLANSNQSAVVVPEAVQVTTKTPSGLQFYDFRVGIGRTVEAGDTVRFHLVTSTTGARNGFKLGSTYSGDAIVAKVGQEKLVDGLNEALLGMQVGGKRRAIVPPSLGFKLKGTKGPVPSNFADYQRFKNIYLNPNRAYIPDIVFDIELLKVVSQVGE